MAEAEPLPCILANDILQIPDVPNAMKAHAEKVLDFQFEVDAAWQDYQEALARLDQETRALVEKFGLWHSWQCEREEQESKAKKQERKMK